MGEINEVLRVVNILLTLLALTSYGVTLYSLKYCRMSNELIGLAKAISYTGIAWSITLSFLQFSWLYGHFQLLSKLDSWPWLMLHYFSAIYLLVVACGIRVLANWRGSLVNSLPSRGDCLITPKVRRHRTF